MYVEVAICLPPIKKQATTDVNVMRPFTHIYSIYICMMINIITHSSASGNLFYKLL